MADERRGVEMCIPRHPLSLQKYGTFFIWFFLSWLVLPCPLFCHIFYLLLCLNRYENNRIERGGKNWSKLHGLPPLFFFLSLSFFIYNLAGDVPVHIITQAVKYALYLGYGELENISFLFLHCIVLLTDIKWPEVSHHGNQFSEIDYQQKQ